MKLFFRIVVEKRLWVTAVFLLIIGAGGVYAIGVFPLTGKVGESRQRQDVSKQRLLSAGNRYEATRANVEAISGAAEGIERFYSEVLPRDLTNARRITYPWLAQLASKNGLVMERRSGATERMESSELFRLRTSMLLAGNWVDIRQFIDELERATEFVIIEDIVLTQTEEADSALTLTLGISTFYREN